MTDAADRHGRETNRERIDRLARVLEFHPALDPGKWPDVDKTEGWKRRIISHLLGEEGKANPRAALFAAVREFEWGEIFGDEYRCCVCDGSSNGNRQFVPGDAWCCDVCAWDFLHEARKELKLDSGDREADTARVIIRARKLHAEAHGEGDRRESRC